MQVNNRSIALVGRPNVGKSRLFNRLLGKRVSIVHDQPGITRDIVLEQIDNATILMDTGGMGMHDTNMSPKLINDATEDQVHFAIQAATLVLFVVDGTVGLSPQDQDIAKLLRKADKNVILVINKADDHAFKENADSFSRLGFKDTIHVSAEHGTGEDQLKALIQQTLPPIPEPEEGQEDEESVKPGDRVSICFAGKPNVGKSSLINALTKEDRLIVSDIPGTTRDSVKMNLDYTSRRGKEWQFELVDTAGLRPKAKVDSVVEYFSTLRTESSIQTAHVAFLVIDAHNGVTKQDKLIAGEILASGRGLVIIVNKWDFIHDAFKAEGIEGFKDEREFREAFEKAVRKELFFLPNSPIVFVSALESYALERILEQSKKVYDRMGKKLPTAKLNAFVNQLMETEKPKVHHGKRFKIFYTVQTDTYPFRIRIFCNQEMRLEESYERYLKRGIVDNFKLDGCPIQFEFVGKPKRYRKEKV